ncbi:butyrophilin subfamily 1 member A1-like [Oreochromis aureus]|uniref:Ig-like domain-containing protein n=1 Tax=Oreochromis aureus TaxID=47969 RepID=A0AAZ1WWZ3_OREAU|nr:butyrophilin subfamily 1 member A1-like [Oreochromis aureus]XP_039457716.1 butyrophilin subfamily 1 member A1-like [Oreochromis aureus]
MAVLNSRINSQCGQFTLKRHLCTLFFHHTVILLLLTDIRTGQSETVTSSQTIITVVGEDVILPCYLDSASDAVSKSLEWGRPDLDPRFVHVWFEGQDHLVNQNPSYRGRTSLSTEKLKQGDLSLKLTRVKHSDNGRYRCFFPSESKESTVELLVGSLSLPTVAEVNINRSAVALQCKSAGWYPEPELLWIDSDGNSHSAGPTETLRGPDDLYTVSSRVTVEKRHRCMFQVIVLQFHLLLPSVSVLFWQFFSFVLVQQSLFCGYGDKTKSKRKRGKLRMKLRRKRKSSCWQKTRSLKNYSGKRKS